MKKAKASDILAFVVWASAVATRAFRGLVIVDGPERVFSILAAPGWTTVFVTLYLSVGATLFGYSVWNGLISRYRSRKSGLSRCSSPFRAWLAARSSLARPSRFRP